MTSPMLLSLILKRDFMHLNDEQISRLAAKVLNDLVAAELITLRAAQGAILAGIKSAVVADLKAEESLAKDAERLLDETLRSMQGGAGIDRHKMLRMIKEKLAKERKIVL